MQEIFFKILAFIIFFDILFIFGDTVWAANYPLEITAPQPSLTTNNRYYKTYTGYEYKVRVGAVGGLYPFVYSLTAAPSGMTIDSATGVITWANPTEIGSPHNITVNITDSESATVTRSWPLTVSTSGFYFLDADNGQTVANGGQGTLASPWKTIEDLVETGTVSGGNQVYFKTGTYNLDNISIGGSDYWIRVTVGDTKPDIWLAYPGHSPVIDFGSDATRMAKPCLRFEGDDAYISGFELKNMFSFAIQGYGVRSVAAWNTFHDLWDAKNGANSAFIMTISGMDVGTRDYVYIHNNEFYNLFQNPTVPGGAFLKHYSDNKLLIEENILHNEGWEAIGEIEGISLKAMNRRSTVRKNIVYSIPDHAIGGSANLNESSTVEFNLVKDSSGDGVVINEFSTETGDSYYYRNTFVSRVRMTAGSDDGTFNFKDNVIINSDTTYDGLWYYQVSDATKITRDGDIDGVAADGIVDSNGNLQGAYRSSYLGTKGYELGLDEGVDTEAPLSPGGLIVL